MTAPFKQSPLIGLQSKWQTKKSTEMGVNSLVLAPEGDVVLVVGAKQFRIHADSLFLKRHSTVFAALFGPNFREGQDLNASSPKEIPLPDDDPDAMTAICATMYHAFDQIPRSPATDFVLSIIRHADKYDCYDVLTLPSQVYGWLKSDHLTLGKDLVNILAVSYLVRDREAFTTASKALVSKYDGSFADLADNVICDVLPWKTFCKWTSK
jgi:BTB/POZ domain